MESLPVERKLYLLSQHRQMRAQAQVSVPVNKFATHGASSSPSFFPKLVPQLTGGTDSVLRRFSIASLTGWGGVGEDQAEPLPDSDSGNSHARSRSRSQYSISLSSSVHSLPFNSSTLQLFSSSCGRYKGETNDGIEDAGR